MPLFPQLATGAATHYPARKAVALRTVVNAALDESMVKFSDEAGPVLRWQLSYVGLSEDERAALENFFSASGGRLLGFTFLDPLANLLAWSEDLAQGVWERAPLVNLTAGVADPLGT